MDALYQLSYRGINTATRGRTAITASPTGSDKQLHYSGNRIILSRCKLFYKKNPPGGGLGNDGGDECASEDAEHVNPRIGGGTVASRCFELNQFVYEGNQQSNHKRERQGGTFATMTRAIDRSPVQCESKDSMNGKVGQLAYKQAETHVA